MLAHYSRYSATITEITNCVTKTPFPHSGWVWEVQVLVPADTVSGEGSFPDPNIHLPSPILTQEEQGCWDLRVVMEESFAPWLNYPPEAGLHLMLARED